MAIRDGRYIRRIIPESLLSFMSNALKSDIDAVWLLREIEMDERQEQYEDYVKRYRPIRTICEVLKWQTH